MKTGRLALVAAAVVFLAVAPETRAVDRYWTNSLSTVWEAPGNWNPNGSPTNPDCIFINNAAHLVAINDTTADTDPGGADSWMTMSNLNLGPGTLRVAFTNSTKKFRVVGWIARSSAVGVFYVRDGGGVIQSNGTFTVSGSGGNNAVIGYYGKGYWNLYGGTGQVFTSTLSIGSQAGSTGSVLVDGGTLIATDNSTYIGSASGGMGYLTVSNGTFLGATVYTGYRSVPTAPRYVIVGGTNRISSLTVAYAQVPGGGFGDVLVTGGLLDISSGLTIANAGIATVTVSNGQVRVGGSLSLGGTASPNGGFRANLNIFGGVVTAINTTQNFLIGAITGAAYTNAEAHVLVSDNGVLELAPNATGLAIGNGNPVSPAIGTITNRNGGVIRWYGGIPTITIYNAGSSFVVTNATLAFRNSSAVNVASFLTGNLTNITVQADSTLELDASANATGLASYSVGSESKFANLRLTGSNTLWRSGTLTVGTGGGLLISNAANARIQAAFTSTGVVQVVDSTVTFASNVFVYGLFEGSGSVVGGVTNYSGSTVAPGGMNGYGALTFTNKNALLPGATLVCQFGGTAAGQYDALAIAPGGTLDISGATLDCQLQFDPGESQTWTLVDNNGGTRTGTFAEDRFERTRQGKTYLFTVSYDHD